jgi:HNH endonuclease
MAGSLQDLSGVILGRSKLLEETFCWRWTGARVGKKAYGKMWVGKRNRLVHRVAYEVFRDGKEIRGRQIHHICGNQWCVNPWHMEALTQAEHVKAQGRWELGPKLE